MHLAPGVRPGNSSLRSSSRWWLRLWQVPKPAPFSMSLCLHRRPPRSRRLLAEGGTGTFSRLAPLSGHRNMLARVLEQKVNLVRHTTAAVPALNVSPCSHPRARRPLLLAHHIQRSPSPDCDLPAHTSGERGAMLLQTARCAPRLENSTQTALAWGHRIQQSSIPSLRIGCLVLCGVRRAACSVPSQT